MSASAMMFVLSEVLLLLFLCNVNFHIKTINVNSIQETQTKYAIYLQLVKPAQLQFTGYPTTCVRTYVYNQYKYHWWNGGYLLQRNFVGTYVRCIRKFCSCIFGRGNLNSLNIYKYNWLLKLKLIGVAELPYWPFNLFTLQVNLLIDIKHKY